MEVAPQTAIVGEMVAGDPAKSARKQLQSLINNLNKSTFDIGDLLHRIRKNGWYEGFNTFQEFVATLEIKPRKAQYLRRIAEVMDAVGITRKQYEPVGIAKLRRITSLGGNPFNVEATWTNPETNEVTPIKDFITGFIEKGAEMTVEEIERHVRTLKGLVGENDLVFLNFCVTRSVVDNVVTPAKELARRNIGTVGVDEEGMAKEASDGTCLEVWCAEYNTNPANNVLAEENA